MAVSVFRYRAKIERVVDGDTLDVTLDLGFQIEREVRVRLARVDTAEIYGVKKESEEYQQGMEHKQFVLDWIVERREDVADEWPFVVETFKDSTGKYGRYHAVLSDVKYGEPLNDALIEEYPEVEDD